MKNTARFDAAAATVADTEGGSTRPPDEEPTQEEMTQEGPKRRLKLTPASDIEPEPVIWAWEREVGEGRIPAGALTLAAGREGTGKSSFGIWLAAQVSRGLLPGSFYGKPRNVLYAAVEDSWSRTLVPRLIAAGADLDRVFRVDVEDVMHGETMISLPLDVRLMEAAIEEHDVAALIIDPLMSTLGTGTDAHRTQDVRQALEPLVRMAERTRALTLGIAHFNKAGGNDPSQLISGSGAFKDLARAVIVFARDRDNEQQVMQQVKNSLGRLLDMPSLSYQIESADVVTPKGIANVGRLVFTGISERSVEETLSASGDGEEAGERAEAVTWLLRYLIDAGGEASRKDIMQAGRALSFSDSTIKRAKGKAKITSTERDGFQGGVIWVHPDFGQLDHSRVSRVTSQSPDPTDPTGENVTPLTTVGITHSDQKTGPCGKCGTQISRYGASGTALCTTCPPSGMDGQAEDILSLVASP